MGVCPDQRRPERRLRYVQALGARESGTARRGWRRPVAAYRAALEEWTRERVPLRWAMTQDNLGNALQALGARESGTARLEEAVAAYRAALAVFETSDVAHYTEVTKSNLATIEGMLRDREA